LSFIKKILLVVPSVTKESFFNKIASSAPELLASLMAKTLFK
jgi:hypothetical protein